MAKRIAVLLLALVLLIAIPLQSLAVYSYANPGDTKNIIYYTGDYDALAHSRKSLDATFVTDSITVDGTLDAAYASTPSSFIGNAFSLGNKTYATVPGTSAPTGTMRALWDGPLLYLFVEVTDPTKILNNTAPANDGAMGNPAVPTDRDSVVFGFDFYNEKVVYETDTTGAFTIDSTGHLTFYRNSSINSLSAVHADPLHPEYTNRIHSYAAQETSTGYNVEIALQLEGANIQNGRQFGIEVQIANAEQLAARTVKEPNPWYPWFGTEFNETDYPAGPGISSNTFWSHEQSSLYTEINHERPNAVDWGTVTLKGWNGVDTFAFSNWRLSSNIAYLESIRFPKGVWRADTQAALDSAVSRAKSMLTSGIASKSAVDAAADQLESAIAGLRWAKTTYPDPYDLPEQFTLPNPYEFFGSDGKSTRMVTSNADWADRRDELLNMAQFYEYGYKPGAPDSESITVAPGVASGWGAAPDYTITYTMKYGSKTKSMAVNLFVPTNGRTANVPVVLSFDGSITPYLEAGIAVAQVPAVTGGDGRSNDYAWGTRTGIFYELFPYARDGVMALNEVSSEMAAAWGASRTLDAIELLSRYTTPVDGVNLSGLIDPDKTAVTGFSINGKYAFVSAVFDDRIDVCIPGAAGATGPSPWRYVYPGQVYDWSSTNWAPLGASHQVAFGTEFMANSIRHNRVRETELFRHFLTPGNFYEKIFGAYGYGARLPYDQNDLVATLAPRAIVLESTLNDYNDGSVTDGLSLDLTKSVYRNLGYDADALIRYNYRVVQPTGDPHGSDNDQRARTAEFLNNYFFGDTISASTKTWLSKNPYTLSVSNNKTQNPYDYYWGGYNTITGGTGGVSGRNGWYYYTFPGVQPPQTGDSSQPVLMLILGLLAIAGIGVIVVRRRKQNV